MIFPSFFSFSYGTQSVILGGTTRAVGTNLLSGLGTKGTTIGVKPQATVISLSPKPQGVQQLDSPSTPDVNRLANLKVQSVAAQLTAGASGTGVQKTIVLPTNLKVNMHNKQYKILYVQKPGASKPELCLQPCAADDSTAAGGTLQGAVPLVTVQQPLQPVPAATSGRNMQIHMVPQGGNKIVMQAVGGTPQGQVAQNVVVQNPVPIPQIGNPTAGSNTSVVTMITTPIPPVPQAVYALSTGSHVPVAGMQSQVPAGSAVSVMSAPSMQMTPSVQMAPSVQVPSAMGSILVALPPNQSTVLAGSPSKAVANQIVHLIDSGVVTPSVSRSLVPSAAASFGPSLVPPMPMLSHVGQPITPPVASDQVLQSNVILQAASASGLIMQAPEPSMKQIVVQGMPQGSGQ